MNFLKGTYGFDFLSLFLIIIGSFLNLFHLTYILGLLITVFAIYRAFSKNHSLRNREYQAFKFYANKVLNRFGKRLPDNIPNLDVSSLALVVQHLSHRLKEKMNYKIVKCPSCNQKLRLPRRKGKIVVTCKKCCKKFDLKT